MPPSCPKALRGLGRGLCPLSGFRNHKGLKGLKSIFILGLRGLKGPRGLRGPSGLRGLRKVALMGSRRDRAGVQQVPAMRARTQQGLSRDLVVIVASCVSLNCCHLNHVAKDNENAILGFL